MSFDKKFEYAIAVVMRHEGGLTHDPDDPGGITNFGVTLPVLARYEHGDIDGDGDIDADDIRDLTESDAKAVWLQLWWEKYGYEDIVSDEAATKVFDLSVLFGPRQAHKIVQRALRAAGRPVAVDGVLGPVSKKAINRVDPQVLLSAIRSEAAGIIRLIIVKTPVLVKFKVGWMARVYE